MVTESAREIVGKGASLLDERHPGWEEKINLHTLKIACCYECMCGQLYGSYLDGMRQLNLSYEQSYLFGFSFSPADKGPRLNELEHAWRDVIVERRAAKIRKQDRAAALI